MKAIVYERYGSPDVLNLKELPTPTPRDDQVLVRVRAAAANAGDWHLLRGSPWLVRPMAGGLLRPKLRVLGADIAGEVERVGANVQRLQPGTPVFGHLSECGYGGFAEYVVAPAAALAPKPAGTTFEEAAAIPTGALTALQGLRDHGRLQSGQRVLINGASGGVGTFAVQIAKAGGAVVTGVCSGTSADLVRSIGADHVVDYTREDFTRGRDRYDLILDAAARRSAWAMRRVLNPGGTYVLVGGVPVRAYQLLLFGPVLSRFARRRLKFFVMKPDPRDLITVCELAASGKVRAVIDRTYPLSETAAALRYLEAGHAHGKVVIRT